MYIFGLPYYPWIPWILYGYSDRGYPPGSMYQYLVDPWIGTVSMDSTDTLTEGTPWFYIPVPSRSLDCHSIHGFHGYSDRGYPPGSMYQYLVDPWIDMGMLL